MARGPPPAGAASWQEYEAVVSRAPAADSVAWLFGYGSIIFKQGFEAGAAVPGYLEGWRRAFYQLSTDHRGVPGAPGRTVTLVPEAGARVWGLAYRLPDDLTERAATLRDLEWREKQYDQKVRGDVRDASGAVVAPGALTYIGSDDRAANPNWGGAAPLDVLAAQIAAARGPSGSNAEYLLLLAAGLRAIGADDGHVFDLEARVRALLAAERDEDAVVSSPA